MKKISLITLSLINSIFILSQSSFSISGKKLEKDELAYLINPISKEKIDSVKIKKGKFDYSNKIEQPSFYILSIGEEEIPLFLNDKENILISKNGDGKLEIEGANESVSVLSFIQAKTNYPSEMQKVRTELMSSETSESRKDELRTQMTDLYENLNSLKTELISKKNSLVPLALFYYELLDTKYDEPLFSSVRDNIKESFPSSPYSDYVNTVMEEKFPTPVGPAQMGGIAPELTGMVSPEGNEILLSSLRGHYVLIDFWASWCGPCRRENPNVVKLYEKYKANGFEVYSVSLDQDQSRWKDAIVKDNLIWPSHVSDLKGWGTIATKLYGFSGIPYTVLIDEKGKIIATQLRGANLENKLQEIYGF